MDRHELCHRWAHQTHKSGTASALSFDGPILYSYSTEIGRILKPGLALVNDTRYSPSTGRHQSGMRGAIPHGWIIAHVDGCGACLDAATVNASAKEHIDRLRKMQYKSEEAARSDLANLEALGKAGRHLKVRRQYTNPKWIAQFSEALPWAECQEQWKLARAKQLARERTRKAKEQARYQENLAKWRAGKTNYVSGYSHADALRMNGDTIETSKGAKVPAAEGRILWKAWNSGKNVIGQQIGHYRVTAQADDLLTIGCHKIAKDEADQFATDQGWS